MEENVAVMGDHNIFILGRDFGNTKIFELINWR